ncbi:hypothetical protein TIFTF001_030753 [Ficus carica]|uniref:Uncharacterized protein n=1 Tax=Ficus carica TaxID=3494 RepID=A0AA88DUD7_FICCA|nr:hypothetical protein TIFTF001_030753 [Ficus carica]
MTTMDEDGDGFGDGDCAGNGRALATAIGTGENHHFEPYRLRPMVYIFLPIHEVKAYLMIEVLS